MNRRALALIATPAVIVLIACGNTGGGDTKGPGVDQPASTGATAAKHAIVFDVTATTSKAADITYGVGADQSQASGAPLPWHKEIPTSDLPFGMTLLAQNKASGEITCTITVDGKVTKTNKSTGEFAVVTCSA